MQAIRDICVGWLNKNVSRIPTASSERAMGQYSTGFLQELNQRVDETMKAIEEELGELRASAQSHEIIAESLENLRQRAERIERRIGELTENHLSALDEIDDAPPIEQIEQIEEIEEIEEIGEIEGEDLDDMEKQISLNATRLLGSLVP